VVVVVVAPPSIGAWFGPIVKVSPELVVGITNLVWMGCVADPFTVVEFWVNSLRLFCPINRGFASSRLVCLKDSTTSAETLMVSRKSKPIIKMVTIYAINTVMKGIMKMESSSAHMFPRNKNIDLDSVKFLHFLLMAT